MVLWRRALLGGGVRRGIGVEGGEREGRERGGKRWYEVYSVGGGRAWGKGCTRVYQMCVQLVYDFEEFLQHPTPLTNLDSVGRAPPCRASPRRG